MSDDEFIDINVAKVDIQRDKRNGYPEVIYGQGKTCLLYTSDAADD